MTDPAKPPRPHPAAAPKRRANDIPTVSPAEPADDDPDRLYAELRAGQRSLASLVPLLPLNVAFLWLSQGKISQAEFGLLTADLDIQQVEVGELPRHKAAEPDEKQQRANAVAAAFKSRMASFDRASAADLIGEPELKAVLQARTPLVDGVGFRMAFAKATDGELAKPGTAAELTILCRAYIASTSMSSTVKCEAVFSAPGMDDLYTRLVVPLPLARGGRRRLLVSILDNETRQPVQLPPAVAELFHEKNLFDLRLLRKSELGSGLGSAVKGALGRLFRS